MTKRWLARDLIADIPLDVPGWSLKAHKITWLDGSQCIQVMKYAVQPNTHRDTPYNPLQMLQLPVPIAADVLARILGALMPPPPCGAGTTALIATSRGKVRIRIRNSRIKEVPSCNSGG